MARSVVLYAVLLLRNFHLIDGAVSCIGETGQAVDWYITYKLPKLEKSAHRYVTQGLGYVYMDGKSTRWQLANESIKSKVSAVGQTLQQIYGVSRPLGYLMYNDKDPAKHESIALAHSKGVLAFDGTSGFWLVHSVPGFPPFAKDSYDYPETGERYGQSFLCVTFNYSSFNAIGLQLLYNGPQIYDYFLPKNLSDGVPNMQNAIKKEYIYTKPYTHVTKLQSLGGRLYTSFAKGKYFGRDLYSDFVALYYNADLLVETWQNGEGKLPSNCSKLTVENVLDLNLADDSFKETEDHSKWAISKSTVEALVCVGDINRMEAQFERGGGTLCMRNADVWKAFRTSITSISSCNESSSLINGILT